MEEALDKRSAPPPPRISDTAPPTGGAVAQMTYGDAAIRTQQIMTKVALNPSNVRGNSLIHAVELDFIAFPLNTSWIASKGLLNSTK
jgi:hypothetical protein